MKLLLEKARLGEVRLFIRAVNWGEVICTMAKRIGLAMAISNLKTILAALESVAVEEDLAIMMLARHSQ